MAVCGLRLTIWRVGLDAVQLRHGDIHHHHVGVSGGGHFHGLAAVGGFADHFDSRRWRSSSRRKPLRITV